MLTTKSSSLYRRNWRLARQKWGLERNHPLLAALKSLTEDFALSVSAGDVILLQGNWYVTHAGLLRIAKRNRCSGMKVQFIRELSDPVARRFAFEATVFKSKTCQGFVGYGDADPSNVSPLVRGAEIRVAETRAVNRALRKAYGIGICSAEEIGTFPAPIEKLPPRSTHGNGNGNGTGPRVRDQLVELIRRHKLDAKPVKSFACDFCGAETLRDATREQVENFVQQLADWAEKDRPGLLCHLNSYARPKQEVIA